LTDRATQRSRVAAGRSRSSTEHDELVAADTEEVLGEKYVPRRVE
jgi:hypothetical protein